MAQIVAEKAKMPYVDLDKLVEDMADMSIERIFDELGEEEFRRLESQVLKETMQKSTDCCVATGGGAILDKENRKLLKQKSTVVWLKVSPQELALRISRRDKLQKNGCSGQTRPLLKNKPLLQSLKELSAQRYELYQQTADIILDGDMQTASKLANMTLLQRQVR